MRIIDLEDTDDEEEMKTKWRDFEAETLIDLRGEMHEVVCGSYDEAVEALGHSPPPPCLLPPKTQVVATTKGFGFFGPHHASRTRGFDPSWVRLKAFPPTLKQSPPRLISVQIILILWNSPCIRTMLPSYAKSF